MSNLTANARGVADRFPRGRGHSRLRRDLLFDIRRRRTAELGANGGGRCTPKVSKRKINAGFMK